MTKARRPIHLAQTTRRTAVVQTTRKAIYYTTTRLHKGQQLQRYQVYRGAPVKAREPCKNMDNVWLPESRAKETAANDKAEEKGIDPDEKVFQPTMEPTQCHKKGQTQGSSSNTRTDSHQVTNVRRDLQTVIGFFATCSAPPEKSGKLI